MNKAKITFHFDHSGNRVEGTNKGKPGLNKVIPFMREEAIVENKMESPVIINEFTTDFGPWQSNFDEEEELAKNEVIRNKNRVKPMDNEVKADKRVKGANKAEIQVDLPLNKESHLEAIQERNILPQESLWEMNRDTIWTDESFSDIMLRKRPRTSWWKAALSISAAVITGVALGFFILDLINQGDGKITGASTEQSAPASLGIVNGSSNNNESVAAGSAGIGNGKMVDINMESYSYSFLQHGVFSSSATGKAAIDELIRKGYGTASEAGDKLTVYTGFSSTKVDADRLAKLLKGNNIDIYVKSIVLPALTQIKWNGSKPKSLRDYIANGDKLIRMMSGVTVAHLEETQPTPFDSSTLTAVRDAQSVWTETISSLQDGSDDTNTLILSMTKAMNTAVMAFEEYEKKPSTSFLWQAQSAMMQYIIVEKQLYKAIS